MHSADDILHFWFTETTPEQWYRKEDAFDTLIRERFAKLHTQAAAGELWKWRTAPHGRLAEIIILDQFSRNLFRDDARAFAHDAMALVLAQEAVSAGADGALSAPEKAFLYMPYMHSESLAVHEQAMHLFGQPGLEHNLAFEHKHRDILLRFGRYPHRNALLGRDSTQEEITFLQEPGSSF